jgi:hypothetical protein
VETRKAYVYLWTSVLYFSTHFLNLFRHLSYHTVRFSKPWPCSRSHFSTHPTHRTALTPPFLDLDIDDVLRWKLPASGMFFQFAKHVEVEGGRVGAVRCVGWGPEMASGAGPGLGKSHCMAWQVPEEGWKLCGKIEDWCPKICIYFCHLHLPPFT